MASSNSQIAYAYEIHQVNDEILLEDCDCFISPDVLYKFRYTRLHVTNHSADSIHHLVSSFMHNILFKTIDPPTILGRKTNFESQHSFLLSKAEPPEDQKGKLQDDITNFVKAAVRDTNNENHQANQIQVILKVHKLPKNLPEKNTEEHECVICIEPLKEEDGNIKLLPCLHVFHEDCYQKWWWKSRFCPLCRSPLPVNLFV